MNPTHPPHPTEAELVMKLCGEESAASAATAAADAALDAHLARCGDCRALFAGLRDTLALVDSAPVPHRGESYGAEVWARIRPHLETESRRAPGWLALLFQPRTWALAATMAGLLLVAFLAGRHWPLPSEPISGAARERILLVAVGDHLERAQMMLVELVNLDEVKRSGAPIDIAPAQRRAEDLVTANRLYRQASAGAGDAATAAVLDELERVLLDIAHRPSSLGPGELDQLRREIASGGILFKVKIIGSQVREREKAAASPARLQGKGPAGGST